jgi:hypothetical protein
MDQTCPFRGARKEKLRASRHSPRLCTDVSYGDAGGCKCTGMGNMA